MRQLLIIISIITISLSVKAQPGNYSNAKIDSIKKAKEDSVKIDAANKQVGEIITKTGIKDLQEWLHDNMPASKYEFFVPYYNAFVEQKLKEWLVKQKK